jgi:hypothetical protein
MWYGSPRMMREWLDDEVAYIEPDILLSKLIPPKVDDEAVSVLFGDKVVITYSEMSKVMKDRWNANAALGRPNLYRLNADINCGKSSKDHLYSRGAALKAVRDRAEYLLDRGTTVNNRKIAHRYVVGSCVELDGSGGWARSLEDAIYAELNLLSGSGSGS